MLYKDLVGEGAIFYILVRIVVRLEMLGELLVLVVRTIVRVFFPMSVNCLENRCVLMIGVTCLTICWCCWRFLGRCWWGLMWGLLISNFGKFGKIIYLRANFVFFVIFLNEKD